MQLETDTITTIWELSVQISLHTSCSFSYTSPKHPLPDSKYLPKLIFGLSQAACASNQIKEYHSLLLFQTWIVPKCTVRHLRILEKSRREATLSWSFPQNNFTHIWVIPEKYSFILLPTDYHWLKLLNRSKFQCVTSVYFRFIFTPRVLCGIFLVCNLKPLFPVLLTRERRVTYSSLTEGSTYLKTVTVSPLNFPLCRLNNSGVISSSESHKF